MGKPKIGLVIACTGTSYGMNLQAFATQYVLERMGCETEIICTRRSKFLNGLNIDSGVIKYIVNQIIKKIQKRKHNKNRLIDDFHINNNMMRQEAAKKFRATFLHDFTPLLNYSELNQYSKKYDAILVGSDQCWLPGFSFGYLTSLRFGPPSLKRISYATSLGISKYPNYCRKTSRKVWENIDYLSVREQEGVDIIKKICGKDINVELVLDPTYLISRKEWLNIIPNKQIIDGKYILSFMLGCDDEQKIIIKHFAKKHGLKLVSILSNESSSNLDITYADKLIVGEGPETFVNLVRNAEFVFTDSFHGIAFSIINRKIFFAFYPKRDFAKGRNSRNSRINNILRIFALENQLINSTISLEDLDNRSLIDYNLVSSKLSNYRDISFNFLNKALFDDYKSY